MDIYRAMFIIREIGYCIENFTDVDQVNKFFISGTDFNKPFYGPWLITEDDVISFANEIEEYNNYSVNNFFIYNTNSKEESVCRTN